MLGRILRDPLTLFALIGVGLFVGYDYFETQRTPPVRLTLETRQGLLDNFEKLTGRVATAEDIARLEQEYVTDELLFREAVDQGLHLRSSDIRGELIAEMRMEVTGLLPEPTDEELVNYYAENLERYYAEPAITFLHVFFQEEPEDRADVLARLRRGETISGDSFWQGAEFPGYGESMVRGLFGQAFVEALWAAPNGEWQGPLRSIRGWHFVLTSEPLPAERLPFERVRDQVESDYLVDVIRQAVDERAVELTEKYGVEIEP